MCFDHPMLGSTTRFLAAIRILWMVRMGSSTTFGSRLEMDNVLQFGIPKFNEQIQEE
jgi:hypothetical protein